MDIVVCDFLRKPIFSWPEESKVAFGRDIQLTICVAQTSKLQADCALVVSSCRSFDAYVSAISKNVTAALPRMQKKSTGSNQSLAAATYTVFIDDRVNDGEGSVAQGEFRVTQKLLPPGYTAVVERRMVIYIKCLIEELRIEKLFYNLLTCNGLVGRNLVVFDYFYQLPYWGLKAGVNKDQVRSDIAAYLLTDDTPRARGIELDKALDELWELIPHVT